MAFTDGNAFTADEADKNLQGTTILSIYTSTGFDSTASNTTDVDTHEISVDAADLDQVAYIKIKMLLSVACYGKNAGTAQSAAYNQIKIEKKYQGGSYSTYLDKKITDFNANVAASYHAGYDEELRLVEIPIALDDDDRANGITIQITSTSYSSSAVATASVTNNSTWIEGAN